MDNERNIYDAHKRVLRPAGGTIEGDGEIMDVDEVDPAAAMQYEEDMRGVWCGRRVEVSCVQRTAAEPRATTPRRSESDATLSPCQV